MARIGGWLLILNLMCWSFSALSEVLPYEADSPEGRQEDGLLLSLNHLHEALLDQKPCDDRIEKIWKQVAELSTFADEKLKQVIGAFDDLGPVFAKERGSGCIDKFEKQGEHCLHLNLDVKFRYWQLRFYCWILGGEMANPEHLEEIRQFLPSGENIKLWVGGRNSDETLRYPVWKSVYGKRIFSNRANFTSIPRDSPEYNCLAVHGSDGYQFLHAQNCEDKLPSLCQLRFKS
ncbi:uncharacterized protein [Palaemon carinicauda]|uniref:uncharacterized protein n=1 Tax=Palaemon carinicauda TaxID=392227 RepID=UPI0035B66C03